MNVGLIGCGKQGSRIFRNLLRLQHEKHIEFIGVFDPDLSVIEEKIVNITKKCESQGYNCDWYYSPYFNKGSGAKAFRHYNVAIIATPTFTHAEIAFELMKMDNIQAIMIEKPMGIDHLQTEALRITAEERDIFLMPGHIERFNSATQYLYELVQQDRKKSKVMGIASTRVGFCPPERRKEYGGVERDLLVHDIDLGMWFVGSTPQQLLVSRFANEPSVSLKVGLNCIYIWDSNTGLNVNVCYREHQSMKGFAFEVWFNTHRYRLEAGDQVILKYVPKDDKKPERVIEVYDKCIPKEEPLYKELLHFINCTKNQDVPIVTAQDGSFAVKWSADKVWEALRMGKDIGLYKDVKGENLIPSESNK